MHSFLAVEAPASLRPVTWRPPAAWRNEPSASSLALASVRATEAMRKRRETSPGIGAGSDFLGDRWGDLMRDTFGTSVQCAAHFQCDERTARNWFAGMCPSSKHFAHALATIPGAVERLLPEGLA